MKIESYYYPEMSNTGVDITCLDYWVECKNHRAGTLGFEREVFETCMETNLEEPLIPFATRLKMSRNTGVRMPA